MNKYKLRYLALIALISVGFANLQAQENEVVELDDLVVVGQYLQNDQINALKTPTPIEKIPQSLTILTSDLISLQDLTSLSGIADYVPGIIAGQGEGHRDDILFRGQKSTADFFVDGVRDDVQYYRPLYNVEQVEVLKGANALFFGRGGTGGLINRVSKTAQISTDFTAYKLSFDDLGERSLQIDTNIAIAPNAALRLNYYTEDLENHRDFYYGDNSGINPTLKLELSDKTTLNVSYENLDHERFIDRGIPSLNRAPVESFKDITFGEGSDPGNENLTTLSADIFKVSVDHKLDANTKLRLNYTNNDFDKLYQNFYAYDYEVEVENEMVSITGYRDTTQRKSTILSADIIGEKEINGLNHKFVIGIESIETTNNNDRYSSFFTTPTGGTPGSNARIAVKETLDIATEGNYYGENPYDIDTLIDDTHAELEITSLYISDEIALSDDLDFVIGGRLDDFELSVKDIKTPSNSATRKDKEFSPRIGLVYKAKSNLTWYASYSESFIPKSGGQYADLKGDKKDLESDVYENTELGVKFDLDNGISVTAAYYDLRSVKPEFESEGVLNIEERSYKGYELQAIGNLTNKWFMSAGASIVNNANSLAEVPKNTFSLWNLYKFDDKLSLGLGLIHKGSTAGKGDVDLPSYTRIDAAAYYKIDNNLRIQLNVENVTDALYFPNSYGTHQVTVGAPLHATLKFVGQF